MVNNVTNKLHRAPPSYNFAGAQVSGPETYTNPRYRNYSVQSDIPDGCNPLAAIHSQTNLNPVTIIMTSESYEFNRNAIFAMTIRLFENNRAF